MLLLSMDPLGKKELLSFYDRHFKDFGDDPRAVRWAPGGQRRRYEALLQITGDITGKDILDFGCGKGDLYGFILEKGLSLCYCGVDVNKNFIDFAARKFPGAEFIAADIEESGLRRLFDIILCCGVFNLRVGGIEESVRNVLKKLFGLCREAMHFNVLSYNTLQRDIELFYVRPEEISRFIRTELTVNAVMRDDLVKGDLFLSIYK